MRATKRPLLLAPTPSDDFQSLITRHRSLGHATPFVSWESRTRSREEAGERDRGREDCVAVVARSPFSTEIDPENVAARLVVETTLRARSIFPEPLLSPVLSLAQSSSFRRRKGGERERFLSLFRSPPLALPLVVLEGRRRTGRVPEIIVRIDPRTTRTG